MSCSLYCLCNLSLMLCTVTAYSSRNNLRFLRNKLSELKCILVIYFRNFICAKYAYLSFRSSRAASRSFTSFCHCANLLIKKSQP